jgi:hypothetical protein
MDEPHNQRFRPLFSALIKASCDHFSPVTLLPMGFHSWKASGEKKRHLLQPPHRPMEPPRLAVALVVASPAQ